MIETIEELKSQRPDLVELFEGMTREELLEQIYKEVQDAINMKARVELFMRECTSMSKTHYTLKSLKSIISDYKQQELSMFCETALEDTFGMEAEEIRDYLRDETL